MMNIHNGSLAYAALAAFAHGFASNAYRESNGAPLPKRQVPKFRCGRNLPCPCGSGKKFKKCCVKETVDAHD